MRLLKIIGPSFIETPSLIAKYWKVLFGSAESTFVILAKSNTSYLFLTFINKLLRSPMKKSILIIGLFGLLACSNYEKVDIKNAEGQITESYQVNRQTKLKDGPYQRFNAGVLVEEAFYRSDTLEGQRVLFYDRGNKEIEETYLAGVHHGPFYTYYEDGAVKLAGQYKKGVMDSTWIKYYPSGQMMEKVEMAENNENGPFVEYYENGNLKAQGNYLDGDNEHGELLLYDENGELERKMECDKGICHTIWSREKSADEN